MIYYVSLDICSIETYSIHMDIYRYRKLVTSVLDTVTILGTRGSIPSVGSEYARFGGNTTCVLVNLCGEFIVLDAGTGLMDCPVPDDDRRRNIKLLLSHPHADHLAGLPLSPLMMHRGVHIDFYSKSRAGLDAKAQVLRLVSPPLWPISVDALPADIDFHELPDRMELGGVTVEVMEGCHPGGVSIIKLSGHGHSVVFIPDCTLTDELMPKLIDFARECSLLLCDGQYSDEEWLQRSNFGHSSWSKTAQLGEACEARRVRIIHHDPKHTDDILLEASLQLIAHHPNCSFATAREEIIL